MTDLVALGAFVTAMITTLGLRDLIKLWINKNEGCGKAKCRAYMAQTASNNYVVSELK